MMEHMREVVIVGAARTPVGSYRGALNDVAAPQLGSIAIRGALSKVSAGPQVVVADKVEAVYMGNVLQAGVGQAPARQAALLAGLPPTTACTTVNKVCASGLKAVCMATGDIQLGLADVVVAGGMESMSQAPYLLTGKARSGLGFGVAENTLLDCVLRDGLEDPLKGVHMGEITELLCHDKMGIGRQAQDDYAIASYRKATKAHAEGCFREEIVPVDKVDPKGKPATPVEDDEEYRRIDYDKVPKLRTSFRAQGGSITAANASSMNDGASAVVLCEKSKADALGWKALARVVAYADGEREPGEFPLAPVDAIRKCLKRADLKLADIDAIEINEAFSAVVLANFEVLAKEHGVVKDTLAARTNQWGGAVSLGHAIGSSGCRLLVTLTSILQRQSLRYGLVAICNGGGGATAMIIERL